MNVTEALTSILSITKRTDKSVETLAAINKAVAFFTLKADFSRDLAETSLAISATSYGETISIASAFTRFRKVKYLKPRGKRYYLTPIDPTDILTPSGSLQPNRFYIAGTNLTYTLSELNTYLEVGYYQYAPTLTEASPNNTHWMLDMIPSAVIDRAACLIFKSVGDDISARFYENSSMEMFLTARRDFADGVSAQAF